MSYQYVNLNQVNDSDTESKRVSMSIENDPAIIEHINYNWRVAIDRIVVRRALTPLYLVSSRTLTVRVRNVFAGTNHDANLDFSPYQDSNGFVNSYQNYGLVLGKAIEVAYLAAGGNLVDVPTVTYLPLENKLKISYNATVKNDYQISFNNALYSDLPSLPYDIVNIENAFFMLDYNQETDEGAGVFSLKTNETIGNLNPISNIEVLSIGLPVVSEISGNNVQVKILTDFSLVESDNSTTQADIVYNALSGQYRYHSLTQQDVLREFTIIMRYRTTDDRYFDMKINSGGSVNVKLIFEKI